jgi:O-antigen/teichoic acid export membrane protein
MFEDSLLRNSALLFLATVELAAGGFLFWQVVAHLYSPAQVGRASVLLSTSTLIANAALLGMHNSLIRYLPEWPDRAVTVNTGRTLVVVASATGSGILVLVGPMLVPELAELHRPLGALAFGLFTVAFAASLFDDSLFIALRSNGYVLIRYTVVVFLRITLVPLLIGLQAFGVFSSWSAANSLSLIFYLVVFRRTFGLKTKLQVDAARMRAMWRYSAGSYLATMILTAPTLLMPTLVAQRLDSESAGYYYIASLLTSVLAFIPQATARAFFAEVANDPSGLRHCLVRVSKITLAAQIPSLLTMIVFGKFALSLFGRVYVQAYPLLVLLALVVTLSSVGHIGSTLLLATGRLTTLCQLSAAAFVVTLGGVYLLIPRGLAYVGWSLLGGEGVIATAYLFVLVRGWRLRTTSTMPGHGHGGEATTPNGRPEASLRAIASREEVTTPNGGPGTTSVARMNP